MEDLTTTLSLEKNEILSSIQAVIAEKSDVNKDDITYRSSLREDLKIDSITALEIILELEDVYGVELPESELDVIITVEDLCEYIQKAN